MEFNPPKGMRDFDPHLSSIRKEIILTIEEVYESYGFEPLITPIVEYWEVLSGKYGEEAELKEVWKFKLEKSDKEYALRYDLTVPLVRYFCKKLPKLPFKRYCIDRVYRHDQPQKGRYREFWQADIDILGSSYPESDAEILNAMCDCYFSLGIEDFTIRLNHREFFEEVVKEFVGLKEVPKRVFNIIDKKDKIGIECVVKEVSKILSEECVEKLKELIYIEGNLFDCLNRLEEMLKGNSLIDKYLEYFSELYNFLKYKDNVVLDLSLVRGLDYYTGVIFEFWVEDYNRAIGAGGRYDNLIKMFCGRDIPAVGGSIGVEPVMDLLIDRGLVNLEEYTPFDLAVVVVDRELMKEAWYLADLLRENGLRVYIDLMRREFKKQVDYIIEKNVNYLIILGREDAEKGGFTFQDRKSKKRFFIEFDNVWLVCEYIYRKENFEEIFNELKKRF